MSKLCNFKHILLTVSIESSVKVLQHLKHKSLNSRPEVEMNSLIPSSVIFSHLDKFKVLRAQKPNLDMIFKFESLISIQSDKFKCSSDL